MLIRYPGSKDKHLKLLSPYLLEEVAKSRKVMEPFSGTAAITFFLLKEKAVDSYVIADMDDSLIALLSEVKKNPGRLISRIENYTPSVEDFYEFKKNPGEDDSEKAFRKLVLHQVSFSGLGMKAGGPLGGKEQKSKYPIDCRWSPKKLKKTIISCSELLNSVPGSIVSQSWEFTLEQAKEQESFVYLDPPYFVKGEELYLHGLLDHDLLAEKLSSLSSWVLSYDDVPEIRSLYEGWSNVQRLDVLSHLHHKIIGDLVITSLPNKL